MVSIHTQHDSVNHCIDFSGQFSTQSTADLKHHHDGMIRVLVTSLGNKREQESFFQQQADLAELVHPNIVRHFAMLCDQGKYQPCWGC